MTHMLSALVVHIPSKREKPKRPAKKVTSVYLEEAFLKRLDRIASELGMSRNELVEGVLKNWVSEYEAEHGR